MGSAAITGYRCALSVLLQNLFKKTKQTIPQKGTGTEQEDLYGFG